MTRTSNGHEFTLCGHVSSFPGCIIERHPTSKSLSRFRVFDCRTGEVYPSHFRSPGNGSTFARINCEDVMVLPYGLDVREALESLPS